MKKLNPRKLLFGALLALMTFTGIGCVVAERPYYGTYQRYDYAYGRPYYPYRYYWYRDQYRWHRDNDRWDRD